MRRSVSHVFKELKSNSVVLTQSDEFFARSELTKFARKDFVLLVISYMTYSIPILVWIYFAAFYKYNGFYCSDIKAKFLLSNNEVPLGRSFDEIYSRRTKNVMRFQKAEPMFWFYDQGTESVT